MHVQASIICHIHKILIAPSTGKGPRHPAPAFYKSMLLPGPEDIFLSLEIQTK